MALGVRVRIVTSCRPCPEETVKNVKQFKAERRKSSAEWGYKAVHMEQSLQQ